MITEDYLIKKGWKLINTLHNGEKVFSGMPYIYFKDGFVRFSFKTIPIDTIDKFEQLIYLITGKILNNE